MCIKKRNSSIEIARASVRVILIIFHLKDNAGIRDLFSDVVHHAAGQGPMTDKSAILDDAIIVLTQLETEAQELKETNEKLLEEIKSLKAEKNELREEKLVLKTDKERIEQQLKTMTIPPARYLTALPAAYHPGVNKMAVFPGYVLVPMWQYLPPSGRDTSQDQELRPPVGGLFCFVYLSV
ncbi:hypothetical protein DITRI_Ditri15bG0096400 [Diplodiscus trichospermus]